MIEPGLQRALRWAVMAALAGVLGVAGYWLLFTTFMIYDDEGYVLLSLRNFSQHGGLYDAVYTQYGPAPYLWYDGLHRLVGFAFDNTSSRWITLVNWFATAVACAALVGRVTRSALWSCFTLAATFTYLWIMVHEPVHPGSLVTLVTAVAVWCGAEAWRGGHPGRFAVVGGIASAVLVLTKINVGVFFVAAVAVWLALHSASPRARRLWAYVVALGCGVLPFVLMRPLMAAPWVRMFALVFSSAALTTLVTVLPTAKPLITRRHWLIWMGWAGALGVGVCGAAWTRGSSVSGLIHGILLDPLKHPGVYSFPVRWGPGTGLVALGLLALGAAVASKQCWQDRRFRLGVAIVRLVVGAWLLGSPLQFLQISFATAGLSYGLSLAWLFAVPLRDDDEHAEVRGWIAFVLIFAALQVFPIAGSQVNWGTFLWIPLLALGLHEAAVVLAPFLVLRLWWVGRLAAAAIVVTTIYMTRQLAVTGWNNYMTSPPLGLPGAERLRLPYDFTYTLRILNENLRAHTGVLFSLPGQYSLNLWTGLPTPTLANTTQWFSLLSAEQQQQIIDRLDTDPRATVVVQRDLLDHLAKHGFYPHGPLHQWILSHFHKVWAFGGYEIWVHRGRSIAGLSLARATLEPGNILKTMVATVPRIPSRIARIELCSVDSPEKPLIPLAQQSLQIESVPCDLTGRPTGPFTPATLPLAVNSLTQIRLRIYGIYIGENLGRLLLVFRDGTGSVVSELLLTE